MNIQTKTDSYPDSSFYRKETTIPVQEIKWFYIRKVIWAQDN